MCKKYISISTTGFELSAKIRLAILILNLHYPPPLHFPGNSLLKFLFTAYFILFGHAVQRVQTKSRRNFEQKIIVCGAIFTAAEKDSQVFRFQDTYNVTLSHLMTEDRAAEYSAILSLKQPLITKCIKLFEKPPTKQT